MEITLKNKCCLYVIISIHFFSITICNLLIDFPSYKKLRSPTAFYLLLPKLRVLLEKLLLLLVDDNSLSLELPLLLLL
jgi:hypothetical protein